MSHDARSRVIDDALAAALRTAARTPELLIACDYDGTLAPIVEDPDEAFPHDGALANLQRLGRLEGVTAAIVSGRSVAALHRLTGIASGVHLIGSHGQEGVPGTSPPGQDAATEIVSALNDVAGRFEGAHVESKPAGAALHYRRAVDQDGAANAARRTGEDLGVRILEGKMVVELLTGSGDKGTALAALRDAFDARCTVFIGDDTTDEAAFRVLAGDDVGIKVGDGPSRAAYRVDDPGGVAAALELVARLRAVT